METKTAEAQRDLDIINNSFYDTLGDKWYKASDDPVALLRAESKIKNTWVINQLNSLKKNSPVLDIGCGAGFLSNALAKAEFQVTGIDLSAESLAIAKLYDSTQSVNYQVADAYQLPFSNNSFNAVMAMDFLEHVSNPEKVISEISRVLKPNGIFLFHTFNRNILSKLVVIKGVEWFVKNTPKQMHVYSLFIKPKELEVFCAAHQLQFIHTQGIQPVLFSKAFLKMIATGNVPENFQFKLTSSTLIAYLGTARKLK